MMDLETKSYRELQIACKAAGLKAGGTAAVLRQRLRGSAPVPAPLLPELPVDTAAADPGGTDADGGRRRSLRLSIGRAISTVVPAAMVLRTPTDAETRMSEQAAHVDNALDFASMVAAWRLSGSPGALAQAAQEVAETAERQLGADEEAQGTVVVAEDVVVALPSRFLPCDSPTADASSASPRWADVSRRTPFDFDASSYSSSDEWEDSGNGSQWSLDASGTFDAASSINFPNLDSKLAAPEVAKSRRRDGGSPSPSPIRLHSRRPQDKRPRSPSPAPPLSPEQVAVAAVMMQGGGQLAFSGEQVLRMCAIVSITVLAMVQVAAVAEPLLLAAGHD